MSIIGPNGKPMILKGVNLGGWLLMEGYLMHALNRPQREFKQNFEKALGKNALKDFEKSFNNSFICEKDIAAIAKMGFNCVRVPFHFELIEEKPYQYSSRGLKYLKDLVRWAGRHRIWVILDLHAAAGAQNHDWHSDSFGPALLWQRKEFQNRTFALWEFLADQFKDEPWIAGYDLLNEAVLQDERLLNQFYKTLIKRIRKIDQNHMIFVEGNTWATNIKCLDAFDDDNIVLSVHFYEPLQYTFNLTAHLSYPLRHQGKTWNKKTLRDILGAHFKVAKRCNRPVFVGEFGINDRQGLYGEKLWLKDMLSLFREFGFSWTYWTYKSIKNAYLVDGIFSFLENPPWVNRMGPVQGWSTYHLYWPKQKREMISSWKTESFQKNKWLLNTLRHAL